MEISNCKKCGSNILAETILTVTGIDWEGEHEIEGQLCANCECFHYELDGFEIFEYRIAETKSTFDTATYTDSDYKIKTENIK